MESKKYWIGVDLGGSNLRAALVDIETGGISCSVRGETPAMQGPQAVMLSIVNLVEHVIQQSKVPRFSVSGVGIGCPGSMDMSRGNIRNAPNVPGDWPSVEFKAGLQRSLRLPVEPLNDVRAITLGELQFGAGKGFKTIAVYAIGTGLGGGVAVNGQLHLGEDGSAGEFGHMIVDPYGLPCNCGSRGCLETIVSGTAIASQAVQAVSMRKPTLIASLVHGDLNQISAMTVVEAARAGDAIALAILERAGFYLGISIANVLVSLSPQRILISGGLASAGDLLLSSTRQTVRERTHMVPLDSFEIVPASLGENAGIIGAAIWASQHDVAAAPI